MHPLGEGGRQNGNATKLGCRASHTKRWGGKKKENGRKSWGILKKRKLAGNGSVLGQELGERGLVTGD